MRKIVLFIGIYFYALSLSGQQEQLYTQFMFNKQLFNPAYVGNEEVASASVIYRDQWNGFSGAPKTQVISFAMPMWNDRLGLGFNVINHSIGFNERLTLEGLYSYRIKLGSGTLSLGLQGSIRRYDLDFTDPRLVSTQSIDLDPTISFDNFSKSIFNFGFGVYYSSNLFYVGAAIPRLGEANLSFDDQVGFSEEVRHAFIMTGGAFVLSPKWTFRPQVFYKYAIATPYDVDLNLGVTYDEKYTGAVTFRSGGNEGSLLESIDLILAYQFSPQLMFGFAYDYTLSDIRDYSNGSIEVMANYMFTTRINKEEIINPRYF